MSTARRTQADVQAHLTRLLLAGETLSAMQASRRLGCGDAHARSALVAMHEATLIYVARMERGGIVGSPWVKVYAWCGGDPREDVPHPRLVAKQVAV